MPDESVQLVLTSPPYNIGKIYEQDEKRSLDDYLEWMSPIISLIKSKLSDSGSVCWQVGNYVNNKQIYPLDYYFYEAFKKQGLQLRNRIIWRFNFGLHANARFSGRYETLLWFTKSSDYKFNLDSVRVPQLYPGKRHSKSKGSLAGRPSGNRKGKNPSDYWEFSPKAAFLEDPVWDLPNVKSNHPEKTSHPCQFPIELAERCILAFTDVGDLVVDPFLGAGTTSIASAKHDRRCVGIDKDKAYTALARERLKAFYNESLKMRPSGKPVRQPRAGESVSTIPTEWSDTDSA